MLDIRQGQVLQMYNNIGKKHKLGVFFQSSVAVFEFAGKNKGNYRVPPPSIRKQALLQNSMYSAIGWAF